jgi:glycosyltransferase involved in cell wall biosynthesis
LWLIKTLFPAVQKAYANARLIVCGTNITDDLKSAASGNQSIQFLENVPELASFYRDITLFVNPIRQGRGLRTKVLEAAAFGKPIVSTPLGAEGLESFHFPLFNDAAELVEALRPFQSPESRQAASEKNRALLQADYSVEAMAQRVLEKITA